MYMIMTLRLTVTPWKSIQSPACLLSCCAVKVTRHMESNSIDKAVNASSKYFANTFSVARAKLESKAETSGPDADLAPTREPTLEAHQERAAAPEPEYQTLNQHPWSTSDSFAKNMGTA
jgi:hypothetical protein